MNKRIQKSLYLMPLLCLILCLLLSGTAFAENAAGRYDATGCSKDGTDYTCDGEYLQLNEDGSGRIAFNGNEYTLEWELDGNDFSFRDQDGDTVEGTLSDGRIEAACYGYDYVYEKVSDEEDASGDDDWSNSSASGQDDDAQTPSDDAQDQGAEDSGDDQSADASGGEQDADHSADGALAGLGDLLSSSDDEESGAPAVYTVSERTEVRKDSDGYEDSDAWQRDYIALNEDGTGMFVFNNAAFFMRWTQDGDSFSFTDHLGKKFSGTCTSSSIEGDYANYTYRFDRAVTTVSCYKISPDTWGKGLDPVTDIADVLSDAEEQELNEKAKAITDEYGVGVYMVLLDDRDSYTRSGRIETLGEEIRSGYYLGEAPTQEKDEHAQSATSDWKDSIVLTVAFDQRKYDVCVSGNYTNWAIPTYGREHIVDAFVDEFGDDNWMPGLRDFVDKTESVLKSASKGTPVSASSDPFNRMIAIVVALVLAVMLGYGITSAMRMSMQNTQKAANAIQYVASDKVNFTHRSDRYIRTIVTRTYSPREKKSGGGGGGFSSSGSSHSSGSF